MKKLLLIVPLLTACDNHNQVQPVYAQQPQQQVYAQPDQQGYAQQPTYAQQPQVVYAQPNQPNYAQQSDHSVGSAIAGLAVGAALGAGANHLLNQNKQATTSTNYIAPRTDLTQQASKSVSSSVSAPATSKMDMTKLAASAKYVPPSELNKSLTTPGTNRMDMSKLKPTTSFASAPKVNLTKSSNGGKMDMSKLRGR